MENLRCFANRLAKRNKVGSCEGAWKGYTASSKSCAVCQWVKGEPVASPKSCLAVSLVLKNIWSCVSGFLCCNSGRIVFLYVFFCSWIIKKWFPSAFTATAQYLSYMQNNIYTYFLLFAVIVRKMLLVTTTCFNVFKLGVWTKSICFRVVCMWLVPTIKIHNGFYDLCSNSINDIFVFGIQSPCTPFDCRCFRIHNSHILSLSYGFRCKTMLWAVDAKHPLMLLLFWLQRKRHTLFLFTHMIRTNENALILFVGYKTHSFFSQNNMLLHFLCKQMKNPIFWDL